MGRRKLRNGVLILLLLALVTGGAVGWTNYRRIRAEYDDYRKLIQQGVQIAGVDVAGIPPKRPANRSWSGSQGPTTVISPCTIRTRP